MADTTKKQTFGDRLLLALKAHRLSITAAGIAEKMGDGIDSRAVATGARLLVKRGQITMTYKKGRGFYRFVRMTPSA